MSSLTTEQQVQQCKTSWTKNGKWRRV